MSMNTIINNSIAEIVHYNLTSKDKLYVENYQLTHEVLLSSVEVGVSGDILRLVAAHIPRPLVASAIGTSASNLSRVSKKPLNRYQCDVSVDLSSLWYELRRLFNFDESFLREWIGTPLTVLGGVTPALLMGSITGRRELRVLLQTMQSGDFC